MMTRMERSWSVCCCLDFLLVLKLLSSSLQVPEGDFLMYKGIHERTMILLNSWMDNREGAETELCKIADEVGKAVEVALNLWGEENIYVI